MVSKLDRVKNLVDKFSEHYDSYKSPHYNETQLRREFLDPFFDILGWDVDNKQGHSEAYKDVIHEASIKIGGHTKAPDYGFRIGGTTKFFVEAKKPLENLQESKKHAYQLKRYAWSAKLPISILTDFEEFVVYDTTRRPSSSHSANQSRLIYFKFTDYVDHWDEIYSIFSKEAVLKGSFGKFVEDKKLKRGTNEVDDEFLKEINSWRDSLAKDIAKNNTKLTVRELNYAVQKTIDRIIFLRIAEDREIENYGRLQGLQSGQNIYKRLVEVFEEADQKYNSGLFHFKAEKGVSEDPDTLTLNLTISDHVLREVIKNLYYPDSPYEFSVFPTDVLGHVYEQFLGKVITLKNHRATIEEKPEVKKAGGVYYTPTYIVDYIVESTVGKLLKGKTPKQVEKIRVLDPACGSGSFLLGAYQYLLDWHRDYYSDNLSEKYYKGKNPIIYQFGEKDWRLTTTEKKRILLSNIFGVDIDSQAVEVTKLSLLLKVLEGENQESLHKQFSLFHERALPDLSNNIKCGNSLIESDYSRGQQLGIFAEEEQYKINPFDWKHEFTDIIEKGGFDVVVGNPPYVFGGNYGIENSEKQYFKSRFESGKGKINLFSIFIEKSTHLLADGGLLSFIIPNTFLRVTSYKRTRAFVLSNTLVKTIVDLGTDVFKKAITSSVILILEKNINKLSTNKVKISYGIDGVETERIQASFKKGAYVFNINSSTRELQILTKLKDKSELLGYLCSEIIFGIVITKNREEMVKNVRKQGLKKFLEGKDIGRYSILPVKKYLDYVPKKLHRPRTPEIFEIDEKILIQRITGGNNPLKATLDNQRFYNKESIINLILKKDVPYNIKYILGLLNSKLINWFYVQEFTNASTLTVNLSKEYLSEVPIKEIDFRNSKDSSTYARLILLVDQMFSFNESLRTANTSDSITLLKRQIETTDNQIDQLVYKLYGLTPEEITIVEGNNELA